MNDLKLTLAAIRIHNLYAVLLRGKRPSGNKWAITAEESVITAHLDQGGNLGLLAKGVLFLDFDFKHGGSLEEVCYEIAPIVPTVKTGSGKYHAYFQPMSGLPATWKWRGERAGEILSEPGQKQVVCPPSIHPDTGKTYRWLVDPREPFPELPKEWQRYLLDIPSGGKFFVEPPPSYIPKGTEGVPEEEPWNGPPVSELVSHALEQPGARKRSNGAIKFQCPACRDEGHDKHEDNAVLFVDGRWGCAYDPSHKAKIAEVLIPPVRLPDAKPEPLVFPWQLH